MTKNGRGWNGAAVVVMAGLLIAVVAPSRLAAEETQPATAGVTAWTESFDTDQPKGWKVEPKEAVPAISISTKETTPFAGQGAVQIKVVKALPGKRDGATRAYFPILLRDKNAGGEVRFRLHARMQGCKDGDVRLSVLESGGSEPIWLGKSDQIALVPASADWRLVTFSGKLHWETRGIPLFVQITNTVPVGTTICLDELEIETMPADAPVETVWETGFEEKWFMGWMSEQKDESKSIRMGRVSAPTPYAGVYALEIKTTGPAVGKPEQTRRFFHGIPLPAAGAYKELRISLRARAQNCKPGDAYLSVLEGNTPPSWLERKAELAVIPVSDDWQLLTFSGKPKPETAKINFFIHVKNTVPAGATILLDDLRIEGVK